MKKFISAGVLLLLSICGFAQEQKEHFTELIETVNRQFINHHFDSIEMQMDSSMLQHLNADALEQTTVTLESVYGELKDLKTPFIEQVGTKWMGRTPVKTSKTMMVLTVTFNQYDKLVGIFIGPQNGVYQVPYYVKSLNFYESKMEFGTEGWKLKGTLSYPKDGGKHPLVIIVHGSGPMDRDGTTGSSKIYNDLAWGLASKNITVFRYDKRSHTHGTRFHMESFQGKTYTVQEEVIDDVLSAIELLKNNSHVDSTQIYIAAHSQGGMLAPLIAQQSGKLKGMILLAANARPIQDMLIEQMNYLYPDSAVMKVNDYNQKKQIIAQATFAKTKKMNPKTPSDKLPFGVSADYWNFLNQYDQLKTLQKISTPTLILQGERDYQVTMTDFNLWKKAAKKRKAETVFKSYPKLNHLFITGEGKSRPAEYQQPGNMDEQVVVDISNWINEHK